MKKTSAKKRKDPNIYPPGLTYKKVKAIADYYDARKGEDVFFFDGLAEGSKSDVPVWIEIPQAILPAVRKLIAKHKKSA